MALCALRPLLSLGFPVIVPPTVGFKHSQRQYVRHVVRMPPGTGDLQTHLDHVAMRAFDLAASG